MGKAPAEKVPKVEIVEHIEGDGWKLLLVVSPDRLTASIQMVRSSNATDCPAARVVEFVGASKLRLSPDEMARLPEVAQRLVGGAESGAVVVAKGIPAERWPEIDWLVPVGISALRDYSDETVDLHEVTHFINVRAGQVLCELPAVPRAGRDVFGETIDVEPCPLQLGDRVAFDEKNTARVMAAEAGCVRFAGGRLSVEQHLEVTGDLNFKVGNIDFCGDVTIRGNVLDGFSVRSAKDVLVEGTVGAATVEAAGALTIKGGVNGGHKGRLSSGGDFHAHYLHMVSVECGGDVRVEVECHDSTVSAVGSVTINRGGIIGGKVLAGRDICAGFIGAEMCVPTTVCAGHQVELDVRSKKARRALAQARALVKNLECALARYAEQPGSTIRFPSQRKTQTIQLQSRLSDARLAVKHARSELAGQIDRAALAGAAISCVKRVYPRVTVVVDSVCEEETASEVGGPVRFVADSDLLVVKQASGTSSKRS